MKKKEIFIRCEKECKVKGMGNLREKKGWVVIGNNAECSKMCGGGTAARLLVVTRQRPSCVLVRNTVATKTTTYYYYYYYYEE